MANQTIPTQYISNRGFVGVGLESAFGTYTAITDWLDLKGDTLVTDPNHMVVETIRAVRSSDNQFIAGLTSTGGDIDMPFFPTSGMQLFAAGLGSDAVTGTAPAVHTLTCREDGLPSICVEKNLGAVNATRLASLQYLGCLVDKIALTGAINAPIMAKYSLKGQRSVIMTGSPPYSTPSYTTETAYTLAHLVFTTVYGAGPDNTVKAFDFLIDNKVDVEGTYTGNTYPTYVYSGDRKISGKLTVILADLTTRYTQALANTAGNLVMTFSQGSSAQAVMTADTIIWGAPSQPLVIGKTNVQELPFTVINTQGNTNGHLKVVAKNLVATQYT